MTVYRTDRDRRIIGDRLLARAAELNAIDKAVGRVLAGFAKVHTQLKATFERRRAEESDDSKARRRRDDAAAVAWKFYRWGYHQVPALLAPSWEATLEPVDEAQVREQLFPLGNPTAVAVSHQLTRDGLKHFLAAIPRVKGIGWPKKFLTSAGQALQELDAALDQVSLEMSETEAVVTAHLEARAAWDQHHTALREVTSGFLRLAGELDRLDGLFRDLVRAPGSETADEGDPADLVAASDAVVPAPNHEMDSI